MPDDSPPVPQPIPSGSYATMSVDYLVTGATNYPVNSTLIVFENYGGGALGGSANAPNNLQNVWQRVTFTSGPTGSSGTQAMFLYPGGCGTRLADSGTIYFKNPKVEWTNVDTGDGNFSSMSNLTTWNDMSGNGNNGTLTNGPQYYNDGYLSFDGSDDIISVPGSGSLNISTTLTAMVWVYYISGNGRIFQKDGPPYTRCWEIGGYGGQFRMEMWHSNGSATIGYGNALAVNGWTHLALTFDGTDIKMYQNSALVSTINFPGDIRTDANTPIFLGGYWGGEYLNGRISNALLYNRALTAAEVQQNFNANRSRFGI